MLDNAEDKIRYAQKKIIVASVFLGILFGVFATAVLLILPSRSGEARHAPDSVSDNSTHG